jgi:hypothetical protein
MPNVSRSRPRVEDGRHAERADPAVCATAATRRVEDGRHAERVP